jgi:hypothetical protein
MAGQNASEKPSNESKSGCLSLLLCAFSAGWVLPLATAADTVLSIKIQETLLLWKDQPLEQEHLTLVLAQLRLANFMLMFGALWAIAALFYWSRRLQALCRSTHT